jgi:Ca2+-binding EF-hand superfamily protein
MSREWAEHICCFVYLRNFSHVCDSNGIMSRIFDELDRNRDQRISKHEFKLYKNALLDREKRLNRSTFEEKLGSTFAIFDRNQDNYITPHEIRETMHNLGEYIDDNLIDEMMETADTDHDGRISRDEFKKLVIDLHSKK